MMRSSPRAGSIVDPTPIAMRATDPPKYPADLREPAVQKDADLIQTLLNLLAEIGGVHGALG